MRIFKTYLRAFELADYQTTLRWHNDDEVWSSVVGPKYFVSTEVEKKWIEELIYEKDSIKLAVCLVGNHELIGTVTLTEFNWINQSADLGVLIGDKSLWGQGYATEAVLQILKFGFQERGLHRVSCTILEQNSGSRKVALKCGFKEEGLLREAVFKNGCFQNLIAYAILQDEYAKFIKVYES